MQQEPKSAAPHPFLIIAIALACSSATLGGTLAMFIDDGSAIEPAVSSA